MWKPKPDCAYCKGSGYVPMLPNEPFPHTCNCRYRETYEVGHTIDELGGCYEMPHYDDPTDSLETAQEEAAAYMAKGRCGFIRRCRDGATLMPDGTWLANPRYDYGVELPDARLQAYYPALYEG